MKTHSLFLFAGEASGDLHGASLMQALREQGLCDSFWGVGGQGMRRLGLDSLLPMEDFQVMGYSDVWRALPRLYRHFYTIREALLQRQPSVAIFVDYPGFNLRLERSLRKAGYSGKIVHFNSPMVWAHGRKRVDVLAENVDLLITLLPFEKAYYANTSLRVDYVGHPLVTRVTKHSYSPNWRKSYGIPPSLPLLGLFPGSRAGEIRRNLSTQLQAAKQLSKQLPHFGWGLAVAHAELRPAIEKAIHESSLKLGEQIFLVDTSSSYELMAECRAALATSGTVTAELALHHVPSVVSFQLSLLNLLVVGLVLRVQLPHYCLVNIICEDRVFPEFYGVRPDPTHMANALYPLIQEGEKRARCIAGCEHMRTRLGSGHAAEHAALSIGELIHES